ncbi:DsbE family thiol:disulfide interchange protein [Albirhodobacter sp. R86504]|uniref:DsbE family thiol:disulfide interchange protein n=1 Tax=Albirhodobacter sp. R86504 TaxID=3093848 RepID=UPI003671A672
MAKWGMIAPPVVFAGLAGMFLWGMSRENPNDLPSVLIGQAAPAVIVEPMAGQAPFSSAMLSQDGVKLVNFWASWCAPCRVEHPNLQDLADEGLAIYGVNYKDDAQKAQGFLDELGSPYAAIGTDAKGKMALEWGVYGVPETFVLDGEGRVLARFAGPLTKRLIEEKLRPVMQEASGE